MKQPEKDAIFWQMRVASLFLLTFLAGFGGVTKEVAAQTMSPAAASRRPELALQIGHTDGVLAVTFAPQGKVVATASQDTSVKLWDIATGQLLRTLTGHNDAVMAVAFPPDGRTLATSSRDQTVKLWDIRSGQLLRTLTDIAIEQSAPAVFSADGKTLATGGPDNTVKLWDVPESPPAGMVPDTIQAQVRRTLTGHEAEVTAVAFSPDGDIVASGSADKTVRLWNAGNGELLGTLAGHDRPVDAVAFAPDGKTVASASADKTVKLWNVRTRALVRTLALPKEVVGSTMSVVFAPDGKTVAAGNYNSAWLWKAESGALLRTITEAGDVVKVGFALDGRTLATWDNAVGVKLWTAATGELRLTLQGHVAELWSIAFSPDGKTLASANKSDETIQLWDAHTGQLWRVLRGHYGVSSVAFAPNGKTLASGSWSDRTIKVWDVGSGALQKTLRTEGEVTSVAFAPDGRTLVSGSQDGVVRLWNVQVGEVRRELKGHSDGVYAVAFSPDGKTVASGSRDNSVRVWDAATGDVFLSLTGHQDVVMSVAFAPDGKTLASGSRDHTIKLWDVASGEVRRTMSGHRAAVFSIAFAPDGKTLASAGADQSVQLWDVSSGQPTLLAGAAAGGGHHGAVYAVAYAPDGKTLASSSADSTVKLWNPGNGRLLGTLLALPSDAQDEGTGNWLALSPEGYYDGSPGAGRFINWRVGDDLFPVEAYERVFKRPDLLRRALSGEVLPSTSETQKFVSGEAIPPRVMFVNPNEGQVVTGDELNVELTASAADDVAQVDLLVNGRPAVARHVPATGERNTTIARTTAQPGSRGVQLAPVRYKVSRQFQVRVPLPRGERSVTLKAIASNKDSLQGWQEIRLRRSGGATVAGDLYVLAVGINNYQDARYNLKYAANDAKAFAGLWPRMQGKLYRRVVVKQLTDAQATTINVQSALDSLVEAATVNDSVVLFLGGHGVQVNDRDFYFATHDINFDHPQQTGLPWTAFQDTLARLDARRVVLFLDACHSGAALGEQRASNERMAELLVKRAGVVVFASSLGSQVSYEFDEFQHGAFTRALIEGIAESKADLELGAGRDGIINIEELLAYLRSRVPQMTKQQQTPACPLIRDFGEPFPLANTP